MKRKLLNLSIILILFSFLFFVLGTELYFNYKDNKLRGQAYKNLNLFFKDQKKSKFIEEINYIGETNYKIIKIPSFPSFKRTGRLSPELDSMLNEMMTPKVKNEIIEEWRYKYGDIYRLYKSIQPTNRFFKETRLFTLDKVVISSIFINEIGFRNTYSNYYYSNQSIKDAENFAFNYLKNNEKSIIKPYMYYGDPDEPFNLSIYGKLDKEVYNEFYYIKQDSIPTAYFGFSGESGRPVDYFTFSNDRYVINMYQTQPKVYSIYKNHELINAIKNEFLRNGLILLSLMLIISSLWRIIINKKENETEYEKLIRLTNPSNFMKPYDAVKVEKANNIFLELQKIGKEDFASLKEIRKIAINELGINFLEKEKLNKLIKKSNPENFVKPYNAENVKIANEIYSKLTKRKIDIDEYEELERKINELYKKKYS